MNLMLTARCNNSDDFKKFGYNTVKSEFSEWCDSSKCVFGKIDEKNIVELFFDVNPAKLKEWLSKPSTQEIFKTHNFVPTRYTFEPLSI
ncbi:MAG: hypothetical protein HQ474_12280 [Flammeovirgaceae bacterium]|jgi:hypothetical protein|nr:hypothetical protein [Flammeovirgaceae bacterium]|tara:strand:+ start:717 stop:983 length:267 start_codon:yes stop_codon:yes gene_type:complete